MTFDCNASLGNYALRQLRHNTADGLLALMDRKRIDRALVGSAEAITLLDAHSGNEMLSRAIGSHGDRLVPCAVLNPAYAGWEVDLRHCAENLGMVALKLLPHWHGYKLTDACCGEIIAAATELSLPILLPVRVQDGRQLGWLFDVPDLSLADIAATIRAHPAARFVILEGIGIAHSALATERESLPDNYWVEMSRMAVFIGKEIQALVAALGAQRVLFGSGMPLKYVDPALLKLKHLDVSPTEKSAILGGNLQDLLGL
jgi:hypothetical protein